MKKINILVEGPDNVGKSTLITNIKNCYNDITFHALHYSSVKQSTADDVVKYSTKLYTEMFDLLNTSFKRENVGFICDRSHLGEMVYGPIYRGYTGEYVLDIEKKFTYISHLWNSIHLITLYDEPRNLINRDDGLSFSTELDKKHREIELFLNAHDKSLIKNKLKLNISEHNADQALRAVVDFIGESND